MVLTRLNEVIAFAAISEGNAIDDSMLDERFYRAKGRRSPHRCLMLTHRVPERLDREIAICLGKPEDLLDHSAPWPRVIAASSVERGDDAIKRDLFHEHPFFYLLIVPQQHPITTILIADLARENYLPVPLASADSSDCN